MSGRRAQLREDGIDDPDRAAERDAGNPRAQRRQRRGDGGLRRVVEPGNRANRPSRDGGAELGGARGAEVLIDRRELRDRDRARLEQPAQIGGQIGDGRLEQDPGAGLVHVLETLPQLRVAVERHGGIDERAEVDVG